MKKISTLMSTAALIVAAFVLPNESAMADSESEKPYFAVVPQENKRVYNSDLIYACSNIEVINCITEISIIASDGSIRPLRFRRFNYVLDIPINNRKEMSRQGEQIWSDASGEEFNIRSALTIRGGFYAPNLQFRIAKSGVGFNQPMADSVFRVGVKLAESFSSIRGYLRDTSFNATSSNGEHTMVITGTAVRTPQFNLFQVGTIWVTPEKADYSTTEWRIFGGNNNGLLGRSACIEDFTLFTATSAFEDQPPTWDGSGISWKLSGVHKWEDGSTIIGFYETSIPVSLFTCSFGLRASQIPTSFVFEVTDGDEKQSAVHLVSVSDNLVKISSTGFHFSSVKIGMYPNFPKVGTEEIPVTTKINRSKKTTLCVKGNSTRKPSPKKPVCPNGWKLQKVRPKSS